MCKVVLFHEGGAVVTEVVSCLDQGGVIGYPTETVYGLGGDAQNEKVIDRLHRLKGRSDFKPFLVLVKTPQEISPLVKSVSKSARMLMYYFWPGALTLVFQASLKLPVSIVGTERKVGIRISSDPVCRSLLAQFRKPLISTSANPAGGSPAQSAAEVIQYFGGAVDLVIDGGMRGLNPPSTVLDVSQNPPVLIREGAIGKEEIEERIGEINESGDF